MPWGLPRLDRLLQTANEICSVGYESLSKNSGTANSGDRTRASGQRAVHCLRRNLDFRHGRVSKVRRSGHEHRAKAPAQQTSTERTHETPRR